MLTIDINNQKGVEFLLFPDNQPHVRITQRNTMDKTAVIICSIGCVSQ